MSNSERKVPAASRPSLMGSGPSAAVSIDERTRVLADLGGQHKAAPFLSSRKGTFIGVVAGLIAATVAAVYWFDPGLIAVTANALPSAVTTAKLQPNAAPAPEAQPRAEAGAAATDSSAARIVIAEEASSANEVTSPPAPIASAGPVTGTTPAVRTPASNQTRAGAAKPARTVTARTSAQSKGRPVAKSSKNGVQPHRKGADPDSDLLAAMLRRSDGDQKTATAVNSGRAPNEKEAP